MSLEYKFELQNILQLLAGLKFDICYAIKRRVGFKIAEMTKFLNYIGSYSFALQNSWSENFRKLSEVRLQWSYVL